jgi:tetratricopeptide (TPR) repeat protein
MLLDALARREKSLGADGLTVANTLAALGSTLHDLGEVDRARETRRRVLAIREKRLPPDHRDIGTALFDLASTLRATGAYEEARTALRRACEILEKQLGPQHARLARCLGMIGAVLHSLRRDGEAEPMLRRSLAIFEAHAPSNPQLPLALEALAAVLRRRGQAREALALSERALAAREKTPETKPALIASSLWAIGESRRALGDRVGATAALERALLLVAGAQGITGGRVRFALALVLADSGQARDRVRRLVDEALSALRRPRGPEAVLRARIERWRARRRF